MLFARGATAAITVVAVGVPATAAFADASPHGQPSASAATSSGKPARVSSSPSPGATPARVLPNVRTAPSPAKTTTPSPAATTSASRPAKPATTKQKAARAGHAARIEAVPTTGPTNVRVTGTASGSADIAWNAPNWGSVDPDNQKYDVLVGGDVFAGCDNITLTTCHVTGVAGSTVSIVVRALGDDPETEYRDSSPAVATTLLAPPSQPTNIRETASASGSATITWTASNFNGSVNRKYDVVVAGTVFGACHNISGTTCTITGAASIKSVIVRALGDPGLSTDSSPVDVTLKPPPDPPTNVRVTGVTSGHAALAWNAPASWRLSTNKKYDVIVDGAVFTDCDDITGTTCTITGSVGAKQVVVRAVGDPGLTRDSNPITANISAPPGAPTNIHVTASDAGTATIAWDAPSWNGNQSRTYTVRVDGSVASGCANITATQCDITADNLSTVVVVTAIGDDSGTESTPSAPTTLTLLPAPGPPTNIHATAWASGSATIEWDAPDWNGSDNNTYTVLVADAPVGACTNISAATCTITGAPDSTVSVVVRAIGDPGLSTNSEPSTVALPAVPDSPTNVHLTTKTLGHTRIEWTAPASWHHNINNKYTVSVTGTATGCTTAISTTWCDVTGGAGTSTDVTVRAVGDAAALHADAGPLTVNIPDVPGAPTNVHATASSSGAADIIWTAPNWHDNVNQTYVVTVNGDPVTCADNTLPACHITTEPGTATVIVKAVGDDLATLSAASGPTPIALLPVPSGGAVAGLTVHTTPGTGWVNVTWNQLPSARWNGGTTHTYVVTIDKPTGAVLNPNTCTTVTDSANPSCAFTTDLAGDFTAHVKAVNEAGPSTDIADAPGHVTLDVPTGQVANLVVTTTPGSGVVNVSWNRLGAPGWNSGVTKEYAVTIVKPTGAVLSPNTCTTVTDTVSPSCSFTTDTPGNYTVRVTAANEAGSSTSYSELLRHVTIGAPSGHVAGLQVDTDPGDGQVTVSWTQLPDAGWNDAITREYHVTVDGPAGAVLSPSDCDDVADDPTPGCSFTTQTSGLYTVHVRAKSEAGLGAEESTESGTVALVEPSGQVADLLVQAPLGSKVVTVTWSPLPAAGWNAAATHEYDVAIDPPAGAVLNPNTCAAVVPDSAHPSCTFTTDRAGTYTVHVTPRNEVGPDLTVTDQTGDVILGPTGAVTNLVVHTTAGSGVVTVDWTRLATAGWNNSVTRDYLVTIVKPSGAVLSSNTCATPVHDSVSPGCGFTTTVGGDYTVHVTASNEVGSSASELTATGTVVVEPSGQVTHLAVATTPGSGVVNVSWDQLPAAGWNAGTTKNYVVTVDKPTGAGLNPNTCTTVPDSAHPSCSFTTNTAGDYTVHVAASNEIGDSTDVADEPGHVTLVAPSGQVTHLAVGTTLGSGVVNVSWDQLPTGGWNAGTTKNYVVTVDKPTGAVLNPNTCTTVADAAHPSCSFTTTMGGDYTVHVKASNEVGPSTDIADLLGHVVVAVPVGPVTGLAVVALPGSAEVTVVWSRLSTAAWNGGVTHEYAVTIDSPAGATVDANDCVTVTDSAHPTCSFTTDIGGDYTVHVKPKNEAGTSTADANRRAHLTLVAPSGQVAHLAVATTPGSGLVNVTWDQLPTAGWNAGVTHTYDVTVDSPAGAVLSSNSCATVADSAHPSCSFTTNTAGDYTVHVAAGNEIGASADVADQPGHVTLVAPGGPVTHLAVDTTIGSGVVNVSWDQLPTAGWNAGTTKNYVVTIDKPTGAVLNPTTCTTVADSAHPSCSFTTGTGGDYTVHVKANNEVGASAAVADQPGHVSILAPSGPVAHLAVNTTPGSGLVSVSWDPLPTAGWNAGQTKNYVVTVDKPAGAVLNPNTCTTVPDAAHPSCSFTTNTAGDYLVHVAAANEVAASTDVADQPGHVTLVAPSGQVAHLDVATTVGSGVVNVTWDQLSAAGWNAGTTKNYVVTVDKPTGAVLNPNTCATVADSAHPSCSFTTTMGGDYTVHVKAANEVGASTDIADQPGHVTLVAPSGQVAHLDVATTVGSGVVNVTWDQLSAAGWNAGQTKNYVVTVDKPTGAVLNPNTCTTVADSAHPSCSFTTGTAGDYTVHVKASNEFGPSADVADQRGHVTLVAPSGQVTQLVVHTTAGSGLVDVKWDQLPAAGWNAGQTKNYVVTIDKPTGAALSANSCTTVPDTALPSCSFTTNMAGDYTVHVAAGNEIGSSADVADQLGHVTLVAPSGQVTQLAVMTTPGSGLVNVSWDQLPTAGWNAGTTHNYVVTIDKPTGAVLTSSSCTTVPDSAHPSCFFTTGTAGDYTVHVRANNEVGASTDVADQPGHVTLVAPSGSVTHLTVDTTPGSGVVDVNWDQLPATGWNAGTTKNYAVTIDKPTGAVLNPNTCTTVADSDHPSCSFTTDTAGDYTVHVVAGNETGASSDVADQPGHVTLVAPSGSVTDLVVTTTPGSAVVDVTWDQLPTAGWNAGTTHNYAVTIDKPTGAVLNPNTCTTVADSDHPSCSFTTDTAGDYTVHVTASNEVGASTDVADQPGHVTLVAPSGPVTHLTVDTTPGSDVVDVSWDQLPATGWNTGTTHNYVVTIDKPTGAVLNPNTCTTVADSTQPSCSFTTDTAGDYTVHVAAANDAGASSDVADQPGHVTLVAPSGSVTHLATATTIGSGVVNVTWDQLPAAGWNAGVHFGYDVTVDAPDGAVLDPNTCTKMPDSIHPSCSFTTDTAGEYTVHVTPGNEVGLSADVADASATVTLIAAPSGAPSSVTVTQNNGAGLVTVTWPSSTTFDWGTGGQHQWLVSVEPSTVTNNLCANPVADSPDANRNVSCTFKASANGNYTVTVRATTSVGPSETSTDGQVTVALMAPGSPTLVKGTPVANSIAVSWTAPDANHVGAGVTGYTVSATAPNYPTRSCTGAVTSSPCTVSGLAAGVAYTLRVVANGPGGSSAEATGTPTAPPTGTPVAPDAVPSGAVSAGSGPAVRGGPVAITGTGFKPSSPVVLAWYTSPVVLATTTANAAGAISATVTVPADTPAGMHTLLATGLSPTGTVRYLAKAVTVATPVAPSGAVSSLAGKQTAQNSRAATVTWVSTLVNWGNGVTRSYTVSIVGPTDSHVTGTCTTTVVNATSPSCAFTGDVNGSYRVTVTPRTEVGASATTPAAVTVNVSIAAGSATAVKGTPAANAIAVSWTAPDASHLGAGVTGYTVSATALNYPTRSCTGVVTRSPCTVSGLAAGVAYTLRVISNGPGGSSAEALGTPTAPPTGTPVAPDAVPSGTVSAGSASAARGGSVAITGTGFKPSSPVVLAWYTSPVVLATTTANTAGAISATVTVPADTPAGVHTLLAIGLSPTGAVRYLAKAVAVDVAGGAGAQPGSGSAPGASSAGGTGGLPTVQSASDSDASNAAGLAVTGTNLAPVIVSGLLMLTAGLVLLVLTNRRLVRRPRRRSIGE